MTHGDIELGSIIDDKKDSKLKIEKEDVDEEEKESNLKSRKTGSTSQQDTN